MAVKIRLRQHGRNNQQTYRIVVTDVRNPRDGKYLEKLGWYNPVLTKDNVSVDADRLNYWLGQGAELSTTVKVLMAKAAPEVLKAWQAKVQAKRTKEAAKRRALKKKAPKVAEAAAPKAPKKAKAAKAAK